MSIETAYAIRYKTTGRWVLRSSYPSQQKELTLSCIYASEAGASFTRVELAEWYECTISDFEVVPVHLTLEVKRDT